MAKGIYEREGYYNGIKDVILTGLEHGWFRPEKAGRIARFYGLSRDNILVYDEIELGYYTERSAHQIDELMGVQSIYSDDDEE
tara:strand:- start:846 stop:1094 length:249 start_codon:yes stop_codon:yes gene_type:complete